MPNDTHASLMRRMAWDPLRLITVNGLALQNEKVVAIRLNGMLQTEEGTDIWNGAGDRGDAAMIAYGASRYALARGDRNEAEQLWPLISWCQEYCHRKLTPQGVVTSDSDELEGRFPSGKANLCTSSLYYDALLSAAFLAEELDKGPLWHVPTGSRHKRCGRPSTPSSAHHRTCGRHHRCPVLSPLVDRKRPPDPSR